jgi:hypothetical protein
VTTTTSESRGGLVLVLLLALVLAVLIAGGLLIRAKRHRGMAWVKAHVTVRPRPGPGAAFETRPGDEPERDHAFAVVPVEVGRSATVEDDPT